ncbi:uncharacterized protein N7487_004337 [Penicillium crustosum]|uniref:uncharacterized protein n=1 Tax=Penicillium crustosum TaxID=36656 RepID=UPI00239BC35B|nr:uncharacterized protein N7487_004337 [Penicillium crustosum]KAJ5409978.1 hypothetical protein N7487_004337 [Penicillium crustosum]
MDRVYSVWKQTRRQNNTGEFLWPALSVRKESPSVVLWYDPMHEMYNGSSPVPKRKSMRQKQGRRKSILMKKAREYSKLCEADVCVGIRLRETGQVFILSADVSGFWGFLGSQLVCSQSSYYPTPFLITDQDLEKANPLA